MISKIAMEGSLLRTFLPFLDDAAVIALRSKKNQNERKKDNKPVQTSKKSGGLDFMDLKKFAKLKIRGRKMVPESEAPTPREDSKPVAPGAPPPGMSANPPTKVIPSDNNPPQ